MKLYIKTDLEGVAGVLNSAEWCRPRDWATSARMESRYHEKAKKLLTMEVNAAIAGFFEGGATEILVGDGHGPGGIDPELLDERVELARGWPGGWPQLLDETFDGLAWVGQHAKSGTPYAHLAHTQSAMILDVEINGLSVGEFGMQVLCASRLGVRTLFASGDLAFTQEAQELLPGIETVAVKRGTMPGSGDEVDAQHLHERNACAVHLHPARARRDIHAGARRAFERSKTEDFGIRKLSPPYRLIKRFRKRIPSEDAAPARVAEHPSSIAALLNTPVDRMRILEDEERG